MAETEIPALPTSANRGSEPNTLASRQTSWNNFTKFSDSASASRGGKQTVRRISNIAQESRQDFELAWDSERWSMIGRLLSAYVQRAGCFRLPQEMKKKLSKHDEHLDLIGGGGYHCDTCFPDTCSDDDVVPIRGIRWNAGINGSNTDICAACYAKLSDSDDKTPFGAIPVPVVERCIAQSGPGDFGPRRIVCSDPCHAREQGLNHEFELAPGKWQYVFSLVRIEPEDMPVGDRRIGLLGIYHQNSQDLVPDYRTDGSLDLCATSEEPESLECGTESGRYGFFDADTYMKDKDTWDAFVQDHFEPDSSAYTEKPYSDNEGESITAASTIGTGHAAVVVTSGFGDGVYSLKVHKNEHGQVKAAYVVFIDDDQEKLARRVCGVTGAEDTCLPCTEDEYRVDEGRDTSKEAEAGNTLQKRRKID